MQRCLLDSSPRPAFLLCGRNSLPVERNIKLLSDLLIGTLEQLGRDDNASPWNEAAATVRQALTNVL